MIQEYGPVYAWWLFAFERFNRMLERVQTHLIYELLLSLPENAHPLERQLLEQVIQQEGRRQRRGMMTQLAIFRSEAETDNVKLPKQLGKPVNIRNILPEGQVYSLLLRYFQLLWPELNLVPEFSEEPGRVFTGANIARPLPYVKKDGIQYGSTSNRRTRADSWALIREGATRVPVEIFTLFVVKIPNTDKPPHVCAIIRRMFGDAQIPVMPWGLFASTLGIHTSYANEFCAYEVIPVAKIDSPLALIPIRSSRIQRDLWVSVSFDRTGGEPDELDDENDN
ncbi:hypothetical protein HGRIS_010742 [Hohenbuehelia grisea]|uniref:Uncharacterized protein n=1 Tax=Hohenbuehelia grisea TaxID=104357 RepID=A0ABR3IXM0_9AGAR